MSCLLDSSTTFSVGEENLHNIDAQINNVFIITDVVIKYKLWERHSRDIFLLCLAPELE